MSDGIKFWDSIFGKQDWKFTYEKYKLDILDQIDIEEDELDKLIELLAYDYKLIT